MKRRTNKTDNCTCLTTHLDTTNYLKKEKIDADYDVFHLSYMKDERYSTIDEKFSSAFTLLDGFRPASVAYDYAHNAVILFAKGKVTEKQLNEHLHRKDDNYFIRKVDIFGTHHEYYLGENDEYLAKAILNTLAFIPGSVFTITDGSLYYTNSSMSSVWNAEKNLHIRVALSFDISHGTLVISANNFIEYDIETALKVRVKKGHVLPLYTVDTITGQINRSRGAETDIKKAYLKTNFKGRKAHVDYFSFKNYSSFLKSKCGVLYRQMIPDTADFLADYISMNFTHVSMAIYPASLRHSAFDDRMDRYASNLISNGFEGFVFSNSAGISGSRVQAWCEGRLAELGIKSCVDDGTELNSHQCRIQIINNKKFYKDLKIDDEYSTDTDTINQHITVESFFPERTAKGKIYSEEQSEDVRDNILLKILSETCIKNDIANRQISMFDFSLLLDENESVEVQALSKLMENRKPIKTYISSMKFVHNGHIIEATDAKDMSMLETCEQQFKERSIALVGAISINSKLYAIGRTNVTPLPKQPIIDSIVESQAKICPYDRFSELMTAYAEETGEYEYVDAILEKEKQKRKPQYTKAELRKLYTDSRFREQSRRIKKFLQQHGVDPEESYKRSDLKDTNGLYGFEGVCYSYDTGHTNECVYIVGDRALNQNVAKSPHFYVIRGMNEERIPERDLGIILSMVDVGFIRENNYTVIPFLFKYLREWEKCETDHETGEIDETDIENT